jgi:demethylmenaquinone methyltransferase/2-methoxy-6-polyprenyl-1,4-benzoquinol methylase
LLTIAQKRYPDPSIQWHQESAENLLIDSESVHVYTISFGLRNVDDRLQSLQKAWDVLVPGGQFWCLEFSHPQNPWIQEAFYAYLKLLPLLGQGVIGQSEPYAYLADSIRAFPSHPVLTAEMNQVGFRQVTHQPLSSGIVTITKGIK